MFFSIYNDVNFAGRFFFGPLDGGGDALAVLIGEPEDVIHQLPEEPAATERSPTP